MPTIPWVLHAEYRNNSIWVYGIGVSVSTSMVELSSKWLESETKPPSEKQTVFFFFSFLVGALSTEGIAVDEASSKGLVVCNCHIHTSVIIFKVINEMITKIIKILSFPKEIVVNTTININVHVTFHFIYKAFKGVGSYFVRFCLSFVFLLFLVCFPLLLLVLFGLVLPRTRCLCTTRTRLILMLIRQSSRGLRFLLLSLPIGSNRETLFNHIGSIGRRFALYQRGTRGERTNGRLKIDFLENTLYN